MKLSRFTLSLCLAAAFPAAAGAEVCEEQQTQQALQYLRRLSLDLRGRLPDMTELSSVVTNGAVDPTLVQSMVRSEDAIQQLRSYHRNLLWTNVTDQRLANQAWILANGRTDRGQPAAIFIVAQNRMQAYRGAYVPCLDEPARFDPQTREILTTRDDTNNADREGWVEVEPYWAPGTLVKVCAFDAQQAASVTDPRTNRPVACDSGTGARFKGCGCGPNLRWCHSQAGQTQLRIDQSFNEQLLRYVDGIIRDGRPYTDVILGRDIEVNGPISHYFRYMTQGGPNFIAVTPDQSYAMPEVPFAGIDSWQKVAERGQRHSGVLSMPGFFLKFQSNRGRANRFYNAFLCQHFEAPSGGLPAASSECHDEPNLTKRCGCMYCHVTLEPAAAHWGRWGEAGLIPLGEQAYPETNMACAGAAGARNPLCRRFYLTEAIHPDEQPYVGKLLPYVFADDQRRENIRLGPAHIAQEAVDSGAFAQCTTKKMWELFMSREPAANEGAIIDALAADFRQGYDLRDLVTAIVTRPEYVKAGRFTGIEE